MIESNKITAYIKANFDYTLDELNRLRQHGDEIGDGIYQFDIHSDIELHYVHKVGNKRYFKLGFKKDDLFNIYIGKRTTKSAGKFTPPDMIPYDPDIKYKSPLSYTIYNSLVNYIHINFAMFDRFITDIGVRYKYADDLELGRSIALRSYIDYIYHPTIRGSYLVTIQDRIFGTFKKKRHIHNFKDIDLEVEETDYMKFKAKLNMHILYYLTLKYHFEPHIINSMHPDLAKPMNTSSSDLLMMTYYNHDIDLSNKTNAINSIMSLLIAAGATQINSKIYNYVTEEKYKHARIRKTGKNDIGWRGWMAVTFDEGSSIQNGTGNWTGTAGTQESVCANAVISPYEFIKHEVDISGKERFITTVVRTRYNVGNTDGFEDKRYFHNLKYPYIFGLEPNIVDKFSEHHPIVLGHIYNKENIRVSPFIASLSTRYRMMQRNDDMPTFNDTNNENKDGDYKLFKQDYIELKKNLAGPNSSGANKVNHEYNFIQMYPQNVVPDGFTPDPDDYFKYRRTRKPLLWKDYHPYLEAYTWIFNDERIHTNRYAAQPDEAKTFRGLCANLDHFDHEYTREWFKIHGPEFIANNENDFVVGVTKAAPGWTSTSQAADGVIFIQSSGVFPMHLPFFHQNYLDDLIRMQDLYNKYKMLDWMTDDALVLYEKVYNEEMVKHLVTKETIVWDTISKDKAITSLTTGTNLIKRFYPLVDTYNSKLLKSAVDGNNYILIEEDVSKPNHPLSDLITNDNNPDNKIVLSKDVTADDINNIDNLIKSDTTKETIHVKIYNKNTTIEENSTKSLLIYNNKTKYTLEVIDTKDGITTVNSYDIIDKETEPSSINRGVLKEKIVVDTIKRVMNDTNDDIIEDLNVDDESLNDTVSRKIYNTKLKSDELIMSGELHTTTTGITINENIKAPKTLKTNNNIIIYNTTEDTTEIGNGVDPIYILANTLYSTKHDKNGYADDATTATADNIMASNVTTWTLLPLNVESLSIGDIASINDIVANNDNIYWDEEDYSTVEWYKVDDYIDSNNSVLEEKLQELDTTVLVRSKLLNLRKSSFSNYNEFKVELIHEKDGKVTLLKSMYFTMNDILNGRAFYYDKNKKYGDINFLGFRIEVYKSSNSSAFGGFNLSTSNDYICIVKNRNIIINDIEHNYSIKIYGR